METRKLQEVGGGTYTVSIPKGWADEHGLEAGTNVHLYTHGDGSLVVRGSERDGEALNEVEIDVDGSAPHLVRRALLSAHAVGFDAVTLRPETRFTDEQRRAANRAKQALVGTELVVDEPGEITVRNLLDAGDVSVPQTVLQLHFLVDSIHREATAAFVSADGAAHERVRGRIEEADRLLGMVTRHFDRGLVSLEEIERLGTTRTALFDAHATARELDRIAHRCGSLARLGDRPGGPLPDREAAAFERAAAAAREGIDAATTAVLEPDEVAAHDALDRVAAVRDAVETLADDLGAEGSSTDGPSAAGQRLALEELRRTVAHARTIANVGLRAALREDALSRSERTASGETADASY